MQLWIKTDEHGADISGTYAVEQDGPGRWVDDMDVVAPPQTVISTRVYLDRFTGAEYMAARTSSDVNVLRMLDSMLAAQSIDVTDPDVAAGLDLMVAQGIIAPARKAELLQPV